MSDESNEVDARPSPTEMGWLNGWRRTRRGFELEAFIRRGKAWEREIVPASWLMNHRVFEPSLGAMKKLATRNLRLRVHDLSKISPLIKPGTLARALVPEAADTCHAIYATADDERNVYVPAALLLRELWLWSDSALAALMTPSSLPLYLEPGDVLEGVPIQVRGPLIHARQSDTALRRLAWLAQCEDAARSWSSVLTYAHKGAIRLRLPRCELEAWAWGVELPAGTLITELRGVDIRCVLPHEGASLKLGRSLRRCPPAAVRRTGLVTF